MAARSIWNGVISFGLVSVPVAMYSATREHEVSFHQFERGTGDRIRYQRVNERTGCCATLWPTPTAPPSAHS
ncbi:MAG TPA: Ku protein [Candidatus Limnocylindrales bacterium]